MQFITLNKVAMGLWIGVLLVLALLVAAIQPTTPRAFTQREVSHSGVIELGQQLLAEQRLSIDGTTSCLSCHRPYRGYTDGKEAAVQGGLNTPPLWALRDRTVFGWFTPGVNSLESMALRPLSDPAEMGFRADATLDRLRADPELVAAYRTAFPYEQQIITWDQTARALAAAIRAIPTPESSYDRFLAGDTTALSTEAQRGAALFAELGCTACHRPPMFASDTYHNIGVSADISRNNGAARVPTLRGARYTAPYFHDGSATNLEDVLRAYAQGGQVPGAATSPAITPFQLTDQDVLDLVAFLESL